MTEPKRELIRASRPPVQAGIMALMDDGELPGVFALDELRVKLMARELGMVSDQKLGDALKDLNFVRYEQQVPVGGKRLRVWLSPEKAHLEHATPGQVATAYVAEREGGRLRVA